MGGTIIRARAVAEQPLQPSDLPGIITPDLKAAMERAASHHKIRSERRRSAEVRQREQRAKELRKARDEAEDREAYAQLTRLPAFRIARYPASTLSLWIELTYRMERREPTKARKTQRLRSTLKKHLARAKREAEAVFSDSRPSSSLKQNRPEHHSMAEALVMLQAKFAKDCPNEQ